MPRSDVAQGPYALHIRTPIRVGRNITAFLQFDAVGCEPAGIGVRYTSDSSKHHFTICGALLLAAALPVMHGGAQIRTGIHVIHRRTRHHADAATFELAGQRHRSPLLPRRQHAVLADQQRHFASRGIPQRSEFQRHRTRSDNHRTGRERIQFQSLRRINQRT